MNGYLKGKSARFYVALLVAMGYAGTLGCAPNVKFVPSVARAWIWLEPNQSRAFVGELKDFAKSQKLKINVSYPPSTGWTTIGIVIVTPSHNDITIINSTAINKYAAAITLEHPELEWKSYWNSLRAFVSSRHRWEDA